MGPGPHTHSPSPGPARSRMSAAPHRGLARPLCLWLWGPSWAGEAAAAELGAERGRNKCISRQMLTQTWLNLHLPWQKEPRKLPHPGTLF